MLARRLIPCLDMAGGRVVKGVHFRELRDAGDPAEQAARYDAEGADEIVFLDIAASHEERGTLIDLVSRVADRLFVPFTVGGGIRSVADARQVLRSGADKVAVNTAAVRDPALVTRLADEFGRQCVIAAVDAKRGGGARGEGGGGGGGGGGGVGSHVSGGTRAHRTRSRGVGGATARPRSGGDPADLDGYRRHPARLRPSSHPGRRASGADSRDRLRRGGEARASRRGARRRRTRRTRGDAVPL